MSDKKIPKEDRILRYVSWARLRKDEDNNVVGILPQAFALRESEEYLSATWVEFFDGAHEHSLFKAVNEIRNSKIDVKPKSGFAIGIVDDIMRSCENIGRRIRVIHEPEDDNKAHAALRQWPKDSTELFARLAAHEWSKFILNNDVPI